MTKPTTKSKRKPRTNRTPHKVVSFQERGAQEKKAREERALARQERRSKARSEEATEANQSGGGYASKPQQSRTSQHSKQRRSQSTTRSLGLIHSGGIKYLAAGLERALSKGRNDDVVKDSLTHPLHTYPARMHPATARILVEVCGSQSEYADPGEKDESETILDPFCGSGTTLVEARAAGFNVIGSDLNPLAVRIARAKIWATDRQRLDQLVKCGLDISSTTFEEGKAARRSDYEPRPIRIPKGVDAEARNEEIAAWYAPHVRRELECIASCIDQVREEDNEMADVLAVCLSSILIKCSKRTSDTSSKEIRRTIARGAPARWFAQRIELLSEGLAQLHRESKKGRRTPSTERVLEQDARFLGKSAIAHNSVSSIISSPPYVGTYDYVDHHRLRLAFLGLPFESFERSEIGARRRFKGGHAKQATDQAYNDFRAFFDGCHDVLKPGGRMALMVGDSVAGIEPVWADELLKDIAGSRFQLLAWAWQERDKLGSLEKRAFGDEKKREHILLFEKKPTI